MLEPNRIQTDICPQIIQKLGNGTYYYNYDIQESNILVSNEENQEKRETSYNFIQVLITGQPNYKDCVKAVIRSFLTIDEEFDLINSYNSYSENLIDDFEIVNQYKEYLNLLKQIKTKVKDDFTKL